MRSKFIWEYIRTRMFIWLPLKTNEFDFFPRTLKKTNMSGFWGPSTSCCTGHLLFFRTWDDLIVSLRVDNERIITVIEKRNHNVISVPSCVLFGLAPGNTVSFGFPPIQIWFSYRNHNYPITKQWNVEIIRITITKSSKLHF